MLILVCNVGSTSLKYKLFNMPSTDILAEGKVERVGRTDAIFSYYNYQNGNSQKLENLSVTDYATGINLFLEYLLDSTKGFGVLKNIEELEAIGFKTVLAKGYYGVHELTEEVLLAMEEYTFVAPSHNPPYIEAIRVFKKILPTKLMVGCFETAFHTTIPLHRKIYALPYEWYETYGIQRFGYHGASHSFISREIKKLAGEHYKLISCHLGGSSSICAILDGKSIDTTFGFSLQTGLPHANRSGDMDAYIIPFLMNQGLSMEEITHGIDKKGGLLGISGISNDLRDIQNAANSGDERAKLAISAFCDSIIRYIGAFYAVLGGLDYLVFTGGIGENSAEIRKMICEKLSHLGIRFLEESNSAAQGKAVISNSGSPVTVMVLPTNEEVGIAQTIFEEFCNK